MKSLGRATRASAAFACAIIVAGAVSAGASTPRKVLTADGKIYACYGATSGSIRLVNKTSVCRRSERRLVWNQVGANGPAGAKGPVGATGAPGPAGSIAGAAAGGALSGTYPNPQLAPSEPLHVVGQPGQAQYAPDTRAYGQPPYADLAYYRDSLGIVHLSGLSCTAFSFGDCVGALVAGTVKVFTLPEGYRPAETHIFTAISYSGTAYAMARVDVAADGSVTLVAPPNVGLAWVSFDGIDFRAG